MFAGVLCAGALILAAGCGGNEPGLMLDENGVALTETTCTTCHASPPALPHSAQAECGNCHLGYTETSVNLVLHENGVVDVVGPDCTTCHGNPPPPPHPLQTACDACHAGAIHMNGVVEVITLPPPTFALTVTTSGTGTGTVTGGAISCATGSVAGCSGEIANTVPATALTLTATAAKGSLFVGFAGCDAVNGSACVVTMTSARFVTATFTARGRK
jgi:hypothetical protein